jgi:uncharacterized protein (TIGR03085 family)
MATWSQAERAALCDLLARVGPDAPTLCAGWRARDLLAHLLLRERRPDAMGGIALPPLRPWAERVQGGYARRPWPDLIATLRAGPPRWSPFALPHVDAAANLVEFFVHHEDVRRAQPAWEPRPLHPKLRNALWKVLCRRGGVFFRDATVGVLLRTPDGSEVRVRHGEPTAVVTGEPEELVLYAFGRRDHARVTLEGAAAAREALAAARLGM